MKQDVFPARQGARKRRSQWLAFGIFKLLSYSIVLILFAILGLENTHNRPSWSCDICRWELSCFCIFSW